MEDKEKIVPEAEEVKAEEAAPAVEETKEEAKAEPAKKEEKKEAKKGGAKVAIIAVAAVLVVAIVAVLVLAFVSGSQAIAAYGAKKYEDAFNKSQLAFFMSGNDKNVITEKYVTDVLCPEGRYMEAAGLLEKSSMTPEKIADICAADSFLGLCVKGQVVTFGQYETDGDAANGPEDLEWIVLDVVKEGGIARALIMTKDIVGTPGGWNASATPSTFYSESTLHEWCNVDFFNDFTKYDVNIKTKVLKTTVSTEDSSGGIDSGEDVEAYAFAPSTQEIEKYLVGDLAQYKIASATKAATKDGVTGFGKDAAATYLVRNVGNNTDGGQWAAGYTKDGEFLEGLSMTGTTNGARVCMNIYLGEI